MRYVLLIYDDEAAWRGLSDVERQQIRAEYGEFTQQIKSSGHYAGGAELRAASSATNVRVREGKRLQTDGPYAETREQLGGYYLVDARDLDEAIALAGRIPSARSGTVEVRPALDLPPPTV
jgi:hypothetical protein